MSPSEKQFVTPEQRAADTRTVDGIGSHVTGLETRLSSVERNTANLAQTMADHEKNDDARHAEIMNEFSGGSDIRNGMRWKVQTALNIARLFGAVMLAILPAIAYIVHAAYVVTNVPPPTQTRVLTTEHASVVRAAVTP